MTTLRLVTNCTKAKIKTDDPVAVKDLYTGLGHKFVKQGVKEAKKLEVQWVIMSALHGYMPSAKKLLPYDFTFVGQPKRKMKHFKVAHTVNREMLQSFLRRPPTPDLQIVGMSKAYHLVFGIEERPPVANTIVVGPPNVLKPLRQYSNIAVLMSDPVLASCGLGTNLVGLTGKLTQLMIKGCVLYGPNVHWHNVKNLTQKTKLMYLKDIHNAKYK